MSLVGRDPELATLRAAVVDAARGRARVVCVLGEAGIGRTALAEAVAAMARAAGLPVRWGRAWPGPGTPAFAPWRRVLGAAAPPPGRVASGAGQGFDALDAWAGALADAGPQVAILDDLHDADAASAHLLWFLARMVRDAPLLVVATWRAPGGRDPALAAGLDGAEREAVVLRPRPLTADEVARVLGAAAPPERVAAVMRATGGNPLLLAETARGGADPLPGVASRAARSRLDAATPATRAALGAAATLGARIDRPLLGAVLGRDPGPALTEAHQLGILADDRFRHELVRAAAAAEDDRAATLRAAVRFRLGQPNAADHAGEIAMYALDAGDPVVGVAWAQRAAAEALARGAPQVAAELAAAAVPLAGDGRAALLAVLAEARMLTDPAAGRAACEQAVKAAREAGDAGAFARAALARGIDAPFGMVDAVHVAWLEEALTRLGPSHAALRARVSARLASARQPAADPSGPHRLARRAIDEARALQDVEALRDVLVAARGAFRAVDPLPERLALDTELHLIAESLGDVDLAVDTRRHLALHQLERGDGEAARTELARYAGAATGRRRAAIARFDHVLAETLWGDPATAEAAWGEAAARWAALPQPPSPVPVAAMQRAVLSRWWGRPDTLSTVPPLLAPFAAFLALERGDVAVARAGWEAARGTADPRTGVVLAPLAELCGRFGSADDARALLPFLLPLRGRMIVHRGPAPACDGPWDRLLARVVARTGDKARAAAFHASAERLARTLGAPAILARVLRDAGRPTDEVDAAPVFTRDGAVWTVTWSGRTQRLPDADGLRYLHHLVGRPGQDVHVLELARLGRRAGDGLPDPGSAGPTLDARARAALVARLGALRATGEHPAEQRFLEAELGRASGLGGRDRVRGAAEKARVNLTQRIRSAIDRLAARDPDLGRHLDARTRTGLVCCYARR